MLADQPNIHLVLFFLACYSGEVSVGEVTDPSKVIGKCLMWVGHCADNWKNLTPDHSVPSMVTEHEGKRKTMLLLITNNKSKMFEHTSQSLN